MYAVIDLAGKQFTVKPEDNIKVPLLDVEVGSTIQCDNVLLYSDGEDLRIGKPNLSGIKVTAEVVRHARDKKIIVFKMKRRKNYRRRNGHRQHFTQLRIMDITA
ncbi:MAG: 50S ribosomal protein L21 [Candidatus Krumholzibacteriota bacterium]|nr:50S ribosomal protein L21 [Candidatus Krumholzibacteriota bacterium]